jgi:hypothetical protein
LSLVGPSSIRVGYRQGVGAWALNIPNRCEGVWLFFFMFLYHCHFRVQGQCDAVV